MISPVSRVAKKFLHSALSRVSPTEAAGELLQVTIEQGKQTTVIQLAWWAPATRPRRMALPAKARTRSHVLLVTRVGSVWR